MTVTNKPFEAKNAQSGAPHRLTVSIPEIGSPQDEEALLTQGIQEIVQFLVDSAHSGPEGSAIIDLRTADRVPPQSAPAWLAYIEAVRGLLQAHTLEQGPVAPPTNLVISTLAQGESRERTVQYLQSSGGSFSRGATYDLRERGA